MAKVLLLGTWLTDQKEAKESIRRNSGDAVQFGGLSGQIEVIGARIAVERRLVVNDRTWKHGMPRSVQVGTIDRLDDEMFVVVDEEPERGRR